MPEPDSYNKLIDKLRASWLQPIYVEKEKAASIKCPVLILGGDRDEYIKLDAFLRAYRLIPHARLAIIPHCGHVGLLENPSMVTNMVIPFFYGLL